MKCYLEHPFLNKRILLANRSVTFGHTTEALKR